LPLIENILVYGPEDYVINQNMKEINYSERCLYYIKSGQVELFVGNTKINILKVLKIIKIARKNKYLVKLVSSLIYSVLLQLNALTL